MDKVSQMNELMSIATPLDTITLTAMPFEKWIEMQSPRVFARKAHLLTLFINLNSFISERRTREGRSISFENK